MSKKIIKYLNYQPYIGENINLSETAWVIGNSEISNNVTLKEYVVVRGDGEKIKIGKNTKIYERCTVHVASNYLGTNIGENCIIGKFSVIHACQIGNEVIVGDNCVIMDGSNLGNNCILMKDTLIPPNKVFTDYSLIGGSPAKVIKIIDVDEYKTYLRKIQNKNCLFYNSKFNTNYCNIEPTKNLRLKNCIDKSAFTAPELQMISQIKMKKKSSIWYSVCIYNNNKTKGLLELGIGSNIQDNCIIINNGKKIKIGNKVTVGHNVIIIGEVKIEDGAVIGMGSILNDGAVVKKNSIVAAKSFVKKNTTVKKETVYGGNPSKFMRAVRKEEFKYFSEGQKIYEQLTEQYKIIAK